MNDPVFAPEENVCKTSPLNVGDEAHIENIIPGGKHSRAFGIITIVLFIGILLSFLVNFGVSAYLGTEELVDSYFDGENHPNIFLSAFSDTFYLSKEVQNNVIMIDYYLFGRLPTSDVILGEDEFLFPAFDSKSEYSYAADYLGEYKPKGSELDSYYNGINELTKAYRKYGAEVFFIVIPNSQTVYSEKMPEYMGEISNDTRLKSTTRYLDKRGITNYLDLTDALIAAKDQGELYNNTEDSLNSRGAYFAYLAVLELLPEEVRAEISAVELNDGDFVKHTTAGKELARLASLDDRIKNRTVSLSTDFVQKYEILLKFDNYEMSSPKMLYKNDLPSHPRVLLQYSSDWDRIIMTDYFSNTFGTTIYSFSQSPTKEILNKDPAYVFCFIHEKDLPILGDGSLMPRE
ncbi:MAG: hypothetical protein J6S71_06970 [Clostridia bacterium]|nr:hypothetical protein [Clostridia bacterium]